MDIFNAADWYWIVGGDGPHVTTDGSTHTGDETRVYSSARLQYVPVDDQQYLDWKSAVMPRFGNMDPTTRIDTLDNLAAVLTHNGIDMPPTTPHGHALAALAAGVQVVSAGTPSLNGTYECDADSQHRMMAVVLYCVVNNTFPGGLSSYGWMDKNNEPHIFTGVAQFKEFATRIADYVSSLEQVEFGVTTQLPGQPVTIA